MNDQDKVNVIKRRVLECPLEKGIDFSSFRIYGLQDRQWFVNMLYNEFGSRLFICYKSDVDGALDILISRPDYSFIVGKIIEKVDEN